MPRVRPGGRGQLEGPPIPPPGGVMPVEDLPARAQAMYSEWWQTITAFAGVTDPSTGRFYGAADFSVVASQLRRDFPGQYQAYDPIGVSQLFSVANQIARAPLALAAADPGGAIPDSAIAVPPWAAAEATREASPAWQARVEITYTDSAGVQQSGFSTVLIPQVLPSTVASLQAQMELRVADQLAAPPGTGTPRSGSLDSIGSITLLAV